MTTQPNIKVYYSSLAKKNAIRIKYYQEILGQEVELIASGYENEKLHVEFFVNDTTTRKNLNKLTKIKITKFLLECWEDLKTQHKGFSCSADGGKGSWRFNLYSKLGFELNTNTGLQEFN